MTTSLTLTPEQAADTAARLQDPVVFAKEVLGIEMLTDDQEKILRAIVDNKHVAATSGHALGKSYIAAVALLWFLYSAPDTKVFSTSSSGSQLRMVLWREIRQLFEKSRIPLGGKLFLDRIEVGTQWAAIGRSTDAGVNLQGLHGPRVMVLVDEADGVAADIWESLETLVQGPDDRFLAMSNPVDSTSEFFRQCEMPEKWKYFQMSCLDHVNVIKGEQVIPGAVSREWCEQMLAEWGPNSPVYEARVLGRWSRLLGRMFVDFDPKIGGKHVYQEGTIDLDRWLPCWAGADWGYAHDTAAFWATADGPDIYITDELVISGKTPAELAELIVQKTGDKKLELFSLSHEAMNRTEGPKSRGRLMYDVWRSSGIPFPTRSSTDRIGGWNLLNQLFRSGRIHISSRCEKLIQGLKKAVRNPDKPEDLLKGLGDDCADALRYTVMTWDQVGHVPMDELLRRAVEPAVKRGDHVGRMYLYEKFMKKMRESGTESVPMRIPTWARDRSKPRRAYAR